MMLDIIPPHNEILYAILNTLQKITTPGIYFAKNLNFAIWKLDRMLKKTV